MEERTHHDVYIKKMHDETIEKIKKYFADDCFGITDQNIWIYVFEIQMEKGILFTKKNIRNIARFNIAHLPKYASHIVVDEDGKEYYEQVKKIGEAVGYDRIYKKWENGHA